MPDIETRINESEPKAIGVLELLAKINFICSIVGMVYIWYEYGGTAMKYGNGDINPIGIAVGVAVLLQGMICWVLFAVIAGIAKNIYALRQYAKYTLNKEV